MAQTPMHLKCKHGGDSQALRLLLHLGPLSPSFHPRLCRNAVFGSSSSPLHRAHVCSDPLPHGG